MSSMTTPCTLTCQDCVVTGQMPDCDADSNTGVMRVTIPPQQGQRCLRDEGNDTGATPVKTTAQCWCYLQRNVGGDASALLAKTPALHRPVHRRPSCRGTMPGKATMPWVTARQDKDATYANVSRLHLDWADTCLTSSMPLAPQRQQYLADGCSRQQRCHTQKAIADIEAARGNNEGASVALITSGNATQGRASTTLDTATMPRTRQWWEDKCHRDSLHVGQGPDQQAQPRQQGSWHICASRRR